MSKSRDYCFTINNYTEDDIQAVTDLDCIYVVYGRETGESGTPHLQGYVRFKNAKTMSAAAKQLRRAHIEIKKGTCQQAIDYCKKDGDVYERGEAPKSQEEKGACNKRRYEEALVAAKEGRMEEIPADLFTRHYATYKKIREDYEVCPPDLPDLQNEWRYGPTGTGKSRGAREEYPDAYIKKANTKWWNRYAGEETVIIDDVDKYHVNLGYEFKIWLDHGAFPAECKGGEKMIRPKRIIITSNYHPREIWSDPQTLEPVLRRVRLVPVGVVDTVMDYLGHYNKPGYNYERPKKKKKEE